MAALGHVSTLVCAEKVGRRAVESQPPFFIIGPGEHTFAIKQ